MGGGVGCGLVEGVLDLAGMTDDQFKILESLANDGPQVRDGERQWLDWKVAELASGGFIDAVERKVGRNGPDTQIVITVAGREAFEAEARRRKESTVRFRLVRGTIVAAKFLITATASALIALWLSPRPTCDAPCQCEHDKENAKGDKHAEDRVASLELELRRVENKTVDKESDQDEREAGDGERPIGNLEPFGNGIHEEAGEEEK